MKIGLIAGILVVVTVSLPVQANPWELGIGLASIQSPDYRGSDESRNHLVPFPYVVYSNRYIKIDREGIAGHLIKSKRIKIDISGNAGVPVDSSKNDARQGMPDLDPSLEVGPALDVKLLISKKYNWLLSFPLRTVLSTDFKRVSNQGWVFNPNLYVDRLNFGANNNLNFSFALGPVFATRQYHRYYYDVDPAYETAARPAYQASGGYSGFRLTLTFSRRYSHLWFGGFLRYDNIKGSGFSDSPLVNRGGALMGGLALTYMISSSKTVSSNKKPAIEEEKDTAEFSVNSDYRYSMKL